MADKENKSDAAPVAQAAKTKFDWNNLNTLAVVSLAASISWVGALVGVITGHIALAQLKNSDQAGKRLAQVGVGLGYFYLFGWIILALIGVVIKALVFPDLHGLQPWGSDMGFHMDFRGPGRD